APWAGTGVAGAGSGVAVSARARVAPATRPGSRRPPTARPGRAGRRLGLSFVLAPAVAAIPAPAERGGPLPGGVAARGLEQRRALADVEQLAGQLGEEGRFQLVLVAAGDAPPPAAGEQQALARPRHADVEQAPLLLHVLGRPLGVEVGEQAVLE